MMIMICPIEIIEYKLNLTNIGVNAVLSQAGQDSYPGHIATIIRHCKLVLLIVRHDIYALVS